MHAYSVLYAEYVEKLAVSLHSNHLSIAACKTQLLHSAHNGKLSQLLALTIFINIIIIIIALQFRWEHVEWITQN